MKSDLARLQKTFESMQQDGFNTNNPLRWGFYFYGTDKNKLQKMYDGIKDQGYDLKSIDAVNKKEWKLHLEKEETLSPEGLHNRNNSFNELAARFGVELYDGWDVEKI